MAVNALIEKLNAEGIPATLELPGGKWCHSPEYIHRRYNGTPRKRKPFEQAQPEKPSAKLQALLDKIDKGKMTPSERALLLAMLEDK